MSGVRRSDRLQQHAAWCPVDHRISGTVIKLRFSDGRHRIRNVLPETSRRGPSEKIHGPPKSLKNSENIPESMLVSLKPDLRVEPERAVEYRATIDWFNLKLHDGCAGEWKVDQKRLLSPAENR